MLVIDTYNTRAEAEARVRVLARQFKSVHIYEDRGKWVVSASESN